MLIDVLGVMAFFLSLLCLCLLAHKGPRAGWQLRLVGKAYRKQLKYHSYNTSHGLVDMASYSEPELHRLEKQIKELEGKS